MRCNRVSGALEHHNLYENDTGAHIPAEVQSLLTKPDERFLAGEAAVINQLAMNGVHMAPRRESCLLRRVGR
jgi:hypothetical protein